jgi:hypothetical protein
MSTFTNSEGQAIAETELADKLAAGEAFADDAADYSLRDRTGKVVTLKGNQVGEALGAGFQLLGADESRMEANRQENESGLNTIRTMAERGASVASAGLTDLAAGLASPELAQGMRDRAAAQPGAASLGSAFGAAVPVSLAGKLAKPVQALAARASTPIGRMAARAASEAAPFALEGALYGASSTAGQLALNQEQITAEKVLSGAGEGALFGGLLGVGGSALGRGLRRAAKNTEEFAETLAKKSADEVASKAKTSAIDGLKPSTRRLKELVGNKATRIDDAVASLDNDYKNYVIKTGPMKGKRIFHAAREPVDAIEDVTHAWNETGKEVGRFRDAADELGRANPAMRPDAVALNKKLDATVGTGEFATGAERKLARRIEREHLAPLREWRERGAADPVEQVQALGVENSNYLRGGMRDLVEHRKAYAGMTPEQAEAVATGASPTNRGKPFEPIRIDVDPEAGPVLQDGRHRVAAAKEAGAENILAEVKVFDDAGNVTREWTGPVSIGGRPVTPDGAPSLSQLDRMRQGVGDALSAAKRAGKKDEIRALGKVYADFTSTIDETIERTLAPQGVDLSAYKEAKRMYGSLSSVKNMIDDLKFAQAAGRGQAAAKSPGDDAGLSYAIVSALTGNFGSAASAVAGAVGRKILGDGIAGGLAGSAARTSAIIEAGAKAIATGARVAAKVAEKPSGVTRYLLSDNPTETIERIREVTTDPVRLQQYAAQQTQDMAQQFPQLAMNMQKTIVGDLQHLAATAPPQFQPHGAGLTPMAPSKALRSNPAIKSWLERAEALRDPATVIDSMLAGKLPFDAIATLKERRPGVWAELRQAVATEVAQRPEAVPFKQRIFLGTAFEFAADYSMQPAIAAELQAPAMDAEGEEAQPSRGRVEADSSAMLTATDRLEM